MSLADRIVVVGFDHRSADPAAVERAYELKRARGGALRLPEGVRGVSVETCHRLELYLEEVSVVRAREIYRRWIGGADAWPGDLPPEIPVRVGEEVGRHLFRVASGLESAVLGEDQILQQLRAGYRSACDAGLPGPVTHRLFHAAFRVGKKVRAETDLAAGGRSLAGAAVVQVHRELEGLAGRRALVLGLGEMGRLAARRLHKRGIGELHLCNRSRDKAERLADQLDGHALSWEWRERMLADVDAVVCATGADRPVLDAAALERASEARHGRKLVVVDLAVPANVGAPARPLPGVTLIDMPELTRRLAAERDRRRDAVQAAELIAEMALTDWTAWILSREQAEPVRKGVCRARRSRGQAAG